MSKGISIAFITSVFGYNGNDPKKFEKIKGAQYFLFTDRPESSFDTDWEIINIAGILDIVNLDCNVRKSRYCKFMGWSVLEAMGGVFDYVYYCDVHLSPNHHLNWPELSKYISHHDFPFIQDVHSDPEIRKKGIKQELKAIIKHERDTGEQVDKTTRYLEKRLPDVDLDSPKFFQNTVFGYEYQSKLVRFIFATFWGHYSKNDITFRDQPLWNAILKKYKLIPFHKIKLLNRFFVKTGLYGKHGLRGLDDED